MQLYDYDRSTACYRVRMVLRYKQLAFDTHEISLIQAGGMQHQVAYQAVNPQQLVPSLQIEQQVLTQSLAIIEYLDECYPTPPLLPAHASARAVVRSLAQLIACDVHPLNNLRVLQYLTNILQVTETQRLSWYHHWLKLGFDAFEQRLQQLNSQGFYCVGDAFSLADVCLVAQVYNADRFKFSLANYPLVTKINQHCLSLPYVQQAKPSESA
ncbi:MAG: maleylacetoacetate isomerase [Legionellales bacterium]|nr:maleylacetoacetate isomerase [Legionellales bacterium]